MDIVPTHDLESNERLSKYLALAAILHLSAFMALILIASLKFGLIPKKTSGLRIVGPALRVDIVAMPKMTIQEKAALAQVEPAEEKVSAAKAATNNEAAVDENAFKEISRDSFLSKLKKIAQNAGSTKSKKNEERSAFNGEDLEKLVFEGNKISKGTSATGTFTAEDADAFSLFGQQVVEKVRQFWKLPSYLIDQGLTNQVQLFISTSGQLVRAQLYKGSGNEAYDQRAIEAVKSAAPFNSPPPRIAQKILEEGLILAFPL